MRALLFSVSLFAILAVGCDGPAVTVTDDPPAATKTMASEGIPLDEVDSDGLAAALAANKVTLVDFTAVW